MRASIVISTKDKLSRLKLVLQALEPQVNHQVEVIIVFDGCNQSTMNRFNQIHFSFSPIKIVCETNVGRAVARNLGIKQAKGEIIIFLDDDRVPCPGFVQMHIDGHSEKCILYGERPDVFFSENEINELGNENDLSHVMETLKSRIVNKEDSNTAFIDPGKIFKWLNFLTGNISVEKKDIEKVGMFDESFKEWGQEDIDLGIRLFREKLPFKKDDHIVNFHLLHPSNFDIKEMKMKSLVNLKYMIKKYKKDTVLFLSLIILFIKYKLIGLSIDHNAYEYEQRFSKVKL
ncbi:glycosyltransferase family 2 protein [Chengkuizengella marina]|uniref:Glycosyltransferase n=1 Tax=Chengkuizengella marina TaxID=2507566 RepID=A0A6N9Q2A5_9BACL|nr:glycosyltransferase [Chengkuizengella marina]NBI28188.1 glycosyltransferase [Chengkuizengella marina]